MVLTSVPPIPPEWLRSRLNPNNNKKRPTDKPPLSGGSKGGGGDSKGPPHKKPPTWVWGVGGAVALLSLFGGSLWQDTPEITFQRLKDDLLDKGVVCTPPLPVLLCCCVAVELGCHGVHMPPPVPPTKPASRNSPLADGELGHSRAGMGWGPAGVILGHSGQQTRGRVREGT